MFFDTSGNGFKGAISNDINQIILSTSIIPASFTLDNSVVDNQGNNIVEGAFADKTLIAGLPIEGVNGNWQDPRNRANGNWTPKPNSEASMILRNYGRSYVEFRNGFPDFEPYKQGEVTLEQLGKTSKIDISAADKKYAAEQGWFKPDGKTPDAARVKAFRLANNNLIWHHVQNSTRLILVPEAINKIPHSGGRSTGKLTVPQVKVVPPKGGINSGGGTVPRYAPKGGAANFFPAIDEVIVIKKRR